MARISGIDLPRDKRIEIGLTYIFGIGLPTSQKIIAQAGVDPNVRVKDLSNEDEQRLREIIDQLKVEGDLRREIAVEHQAPDRHRLLPRPAPPARPARARPANQDERAHPQGSQAHRRRQEEGDQEVARPRPGRTDRASSLGRWPGSLAAGPRASSRRCANARRDVRGVVSEDVLLGCRDGGVPDRGRPGRGRQGRVDLGPLRSPASARSKAQATGDVACDCYHRTAEDVALLRALDLNSYRFSIVVAARSARRARAGQRARPRLLPPLRPRRCWRRASVRCRRSTTGICRKRSKTPAAGRRATPRNASRSTPAGDVRARRPRARLGDVQRAVDLHALRLPRLAIHAPGRKDARRVPARDAHGQPRARSRGARDQSGALVAAHRLRRIRSRPRGRRARRRDAADDGAEDRAAAAAFRRVREPLVRPIRRSPDVSVARRSPASCRWSGWATAAATSASCARGSTGSA